MGDQLMPWHKTWLVDLEYNRVDLVKEGANSQAHIKLFKSRGGSTMDLEKLLASLKPEHAEIVKTALKEAEDKVAQAEQVAKEATDKLKEAEEKAAPEGNTEEEILKSVKDPAVRALLETQIAKTRAAEEEVRKAREAEVNREAISKAKEVPGVGADEETLAGIYKKLKNIDADLCEQVFGVFKSASALINDAGAFTTTGKDAPGAQYSAADEEAAWGAIEKAADAIVAKEGISKSAAVTKAIKENPALYEQYLKAQRG